MKSEVIVLAGGCFWGVEELFRQLPGVTNTEVGYAGGKKENAAYDSVKTGMTGHAEVIQISFDPTVISLDQIFDFFFRIHDPTTKDRQGNDVGTQYRSAIFTSDPTIAEKARQAIQRAQPKWPKPIVTAIEAAQEFFPAEEFHQDYLQKHPNGYTCHYVRE